METELSGSSICNNDQEELLKSAKSKMGEVKEENERLKKLLAQIVKDYQSLEKQISSMAQSKHESNETNSSSNKEEEDGSQEQELVSLTLGSWSSTKKHSFDHNNKKQESDETLNKRKKVEGDLELGLDCHKFQHNPSTSASDSIKNSSLEDMNKQPKEEENVDALGSMSSRNLNNKMKENGLSSREGDDQESLHQPQVKKTRVCIRSRCDSPTIHDGCHWRKYGQKIAKGNPCPRAYYRCTVSPNCPVRKQVQRCPQDMSILITTYEGTHNHPLPLSATAMASATSAAAAMIKTGSLTSQTPTLSRPLTTANNTSSIGLHTSNLITTFNNYPSLISASSHNSHPTVTLDLTLPNSGFSSFDWLSSSSSSSSSSLSLSYGSNSSRNSSFLNFSSSPASSTLPSLDFSTTSLPTSTSWASGYLLPYNNSISNNNNNNNDIINITNNNNANKSSSVYTNPSTSQQSLNETLAAAATKAIASNPNFQSVLAAAISSYVGNKVNNNNNNDNNDRKKMVFGSSSSQPGEGGRGLALFPTALPFSTSSSSSASVTADARDKVG